MAVKEEYVLRRWSASYYMPEGKRWLAKKWVAGDLAVTAKGLVFVENSKKRSIESHIVNVPFAEIADIKKSMSTLVYGAIVVEIKGHTHWFSSLPNREVVYAVVQHFWKERLISSSRSGPKAVPQQESTALGTQLLRITQDSERTLEGAGVMLKRQGEQLDNAMGIMYDMHNDLGVADRLISGFEGWLGNWRLPKVYKAEAIEIIDSRNVPTVYDFPVIFKEDSVTSQNLHNGTLRLSKDGITIMDSQQMNVFHYSKRDISSIKVLSPWEVAIRKYRIGEPDISYTILSTHMVKILKSLEPMYRDKFDLMEPPSQLERGTSSERSSPTSSVCTESGEISPPMIQPINLSSPLVLADNPRSSSHPTGEVQIQDQPRREIVSEAEAEELQDMIARMKFMATDIALEQDSQIDRIDALTGSVEHANDRVRSHSSRIKRLL